MAGGDDDQAKMLAYQTRRGAHSDYMQRHMTEHPSSLWEDYKSELNIGFAEINDSHYAFTMLCKARQTKSVTVQVYTERLYALANGAFAKVDKGVVEAQLVGSLLMVLSQRNISCREAGGTPFFYYFTGTCQHNADWLRPFLQSSIRRPGTLEPLRMLQITGMFTPQFT